jgi:hypothetical protein
MAGEILRCQEALDKLADAAALARAGELGMIPSRSEKPAVRPNGLSGIPPVNLDLAENAAFDLLFFKMEFLFDARQVRAGMATTLPSAVARSSSTAMVGHFGGRCDLFRTPIGRCTLSGADASKGAAQRDLVQ